jgi:hypothetical protein
VVIASLQRPSLIKGAGTRAETPPLASNLRERIRSLARVAGTIYYSVIPSSTTSPPSTGPSFLSIFPREREKRKSGPGSRRRHTEEKTRCPRTVQTDVAVVRLLFGPSLSPLGYGVGSPRSRKLWPFQTLVLVRTAIFLPFLGGNRCCRTERAGRRVSFQLDRAGETVVTHM